AAVVESLATHEGGLAQRLERGPRSLAERPEPLEEGVEVRRRAVEIGQERRLLIRQVAELRHRGLEPGQEGRQLVPLRLERLLARGGDAGGLVSLDDEAGHVVLARGEL